MIRILLVDDQNILRQGIQALLESRPKLKVVGTAHDGESAIEQVKILNPDVVLMDIEMPKMSGITATQKICQQFPKTKVLILSSHENQKYVIQALQAGAEGYLNKNTLAKDLEQAICSVYQGQLQIESRLLRKVLAGDSFSRHITSVEQNGSTDIDRQSVEEIPLSPNGHAANGSFLNGQHQEKIGVHNGNSDRGTPKGKTIAPPAFSESSSKIKKPPSQNNETSNLDNSPNQKTIKEGIFQKDSTEEEEKPQQKFGSSLKPSFWWISGLVIIPVLLIMVITLIRPSDRGASQSQETSVPVSEELPEIKKIAALGRIEPFGEVMSLSAPTSLEAVQVEELLVKVGDRLKKGDIIAILDGRERLQATLDEAKTQLVVAQFRLEKVKAGAKIGEIKARQAAIANLEAELAGEIQTQQATISKLTAELDNAQREFERNQQLYNEGAISASSLDSKRLAKLTASEQLNEASATLKRTQSTLNAQLAEARARLEETAEIRPVDLKIAQAELEQARAAVAKAEADMELAVVRASVDGEILDIHTRPGEALDAKGIVEIGQTAQMMVVAEIDQNDINQVKSGQKAAITTGVFPEELSGQVYQVGSLIRKNDILDTDPAADEDSRVVEVKILLSPEDSQKVSKLTNLEVDVIIEL
ncbi:MAG: response regulator [Xenococcaceae cyanobacterium]